MPCDHSAAGCLHARRRRRRGSDYWLTIRKGAHHYFGALSGETIALSVRHAAFCMRICKRRKERAQRNNSRNNLSQTWLRHFIEPNHWNKHKEGSTRVSRRISDCSHEKSVTDVWGTAQNGWYILHRHQSPLQNFIIMHAFIVKNILRKRIPAEPASGAESLMHQTFRFAPWKSIRFVLERLNFTFRFRPKNWSRPAKRIDFADFSPSGIPLIIDCVLCFDWP